MAKPKVLETDFLVPSDTFLDYLKDHSETTTTFSHAISSYYSREIVQNENFHCLRRLNLATLKPQLIYPLYPQSKTNLPRDSPNSIEQIIPSDLSGKSDADEV
jgi:homoaconitase/3-isopropylmalate dehydratase large subunit